ncbi:beta-galactosidase 9 isoform X1 [Nicotiana tabacum]|uniref:Beta-galactosidase n=4 Tax=Nicotiana tabacum TaxID=4097 RepID=A0A1S3Z138_TOBAC|nr:PREDICTED: beta-galactosidase 9-like isoform X1 [Nicotiana tabacum]
MVIRRKAALSLLWILTALTLHLVIVAGVEYFKPFNVTYDHRALIIAGKRRILISAGIHYPRATPQMWPQLIARSKEGGADVIETYTFWNGHEPVRGQYNFEGRYDIVKFAKLVGSHGLYLFLRIGPYACAEWNFGGFPVWLRDIPGIEFRTDNAPFKEEMERFVKKIVDLMMAESLFSWQGGPIILLQIENEYGNIESSFGPNGKKYMKWAAEMAVGLGAGVPWVMCKQADAPEYIIDTCNAYYCDGFTPNSEKKPKIWTENWDGWFANWGERLPRRPTEDIAFAIARFFQRGGSLQNYYMYFGGTNFGRTAGGPTQITSYDYDAPLDEYGLLRQPKWGHMKDLHAAIKLCEPALVAADSPQYIKLGPKQEAHVYHGTPHNDGQYLSLNESLCAAFIANIDEHESAAVKFYGQEYTLPPWSVSILPDCRNTAFNTAKVGAQTSIKTVGLDSVSVGNNSLFPQLRIKSKLGSISQSWMTLKEPLGVWGDKNFTSKGILEHLLVTKDQSDYLWYLTRIYISDDDISFWEENDVSPTIDIDSMRDFVRIFVNGQLAGSVKGKWIKVVQPVKLVQGYNDILLLSETVGLQNYGAFLEKDGAGFKGQLKLTGCRNGDINLTTSLWTYQVGLKGEFLKVYDVNSTDSAGWTELPNDAIPSVFSWYRTKFDAPGGTDPVALDFSSLGKGQAWVNGNHIGRYWTLVAPKNGCGKTCDYRGAYNSDKCRTNCGELTQAWYHIPRSWLKTSNNVLVIFEETDKTPFEISISTRATETICAQVSEKHYPPLHMWSHSEFDGKLSLMDKTPEMHLQCDKGHTISSIEFASYGNPKGSCQKFSQGKCHAANSLSVVSQACKGKNSCTIGISNAVFGDPCRHVVKNLAVQAKCSPPPELSTSASL